MVRKKPAKLFEDENKQRINVKRKNIYWKKIYIYIGKKRKDPPCHTNWKKLKDTQMVGQKKKQRSGY